MTGCTKPVEVVEGFSRRLHVAFDAPHTSSDGGALLLRAIDQGLGVGLAALVPDARTPERVVHSREEQLRQRVLQITLGYEDCNDAATLRHDPALRLGCTGELGGALSSDFFVRVYRSASASKSCAAYTLQVSNGL